VKRLAITLPDVAARSNLALATWKAARGKHQRPGVAAFLADLDGRLATLAHSILNGSAPQAQVRQFVIHDPKRRLITAACFADRVLHHAILNLAEPRFEAALVDSVYACRAGRGVHTAVAAVQHGLQRHAWVVQVDVDGYFSHINHGVLKAQLARQFKGADFLALLARIIDAGAGGSAVGSAVSGQGLPIGALTSQHFANGYLNTADRLLLNHAGVAAHVRYMDDIVWFCPSRAAAEDSLLAFEAHLNRALHLSLKPGVVLRPSHAGLRFCGYRIRQGVVLPGSRKLQRYRACVQRLQAAERDGLPQACLQRAHDVNVAGLLPAQSLHWRRSLWWPGGPL
jgi:RNA-directed DNA polymerase